MATPLLARQLIRNAAVRFCAQDTPERHRALVDAALELGDPEPEPKQDHNRMEKGGHKRDAKTKDDPEGA